MRKLTDRMVIVAIFAVALAVTAFNAGQLIGERERARIDERACKARIDERACKASYERGRTDATIACIQKIVDHMNEHADGGAP